MEVSQLCTFCSKIVLVSNAPCAASLFTMLLQGLFICKSGKINNSRNNIATNEYYLAATASTFPSKAIGYMVGSRPEGAMDDHQALRLKNLLTPLGTCRKFSKNTKTGACIPSI